MRELTSPDPHDDYWFNDVEVVNRLKYGIDKINIEIGTNVVLKSGSVFDSNGIIYSASSDTTIDTTPTYTAGHYYFVRTDGEDIILEDLTSVPTAAYDPVRKGVYSLTNEKYLAELFYVDGTWTVSYMSPGQINHLQDLKLNGTSFIDGLKTSIKDTGRSNLVPFALSQKTSCTFAVGNGWIVAGGYKQQTSDNAIRPMIKRSNDGLTWEEIASPTGGALTGVENWKVSYYKSIGGVPAFYLACDNLGGTANAIGIIRSTNNGSTWSLVGSGTGNIAMMGWFNNRLVVYGGYNASSYWVFLHSTNGTTWNAISASSLPTSAYRFQGLAYGAGKYVVTMKNSASPYQQNSYTSTDLSTWSAANLIVNGRQAGSSQYALLDYSNGMFLAACEGTTSLSYLASSTNGTSWTLRGYYSTEMEVARIVGLGDSFLVANLYGIYTTRDGNALRPLPAAPLWRATGDSSPWIRYYPDDKIIITPSLSGASYLDAGPAGVRTSFISSSFYTLKKLEEYDV